jgi:prepilin-type N-terminal cleavage/methylation domain-containing protein
MKIRNNNSGFTLVELLIAIAIMAILAALVFVALNPLARFQDSRNSRRWADVNAILSAIKLHQIDHQGEFIYNIEQILPDTYYQIGLGASDISCDYPDTPLDLACVDIAELVDLGYLVSVPIDPSHTNDAANPAESYQTHYYLWKDSKGFITVGACSEELGSNEEVPPISVSQ